MIDRSLIKTRIAVDARGKIKSGMKKNNLPVKLDYFNIALFPELIEAYGEKPKKIIIFMPSNDIDECMDYDFNRWARSGQSGKGFKMRSCNGLMCRHRMDYELKGHEFKEGTESKCVCKELLNPENKEDKKQMCKADIYLRAYVFIPEFKRVENPMCYLFETHSVNSGDRLYSMLEQIHKLNDGRLLGVPFVLSVDLVSRGSSVKEMYPLWHLQPALPTMSAIRKLSDGVAQSEMLLPEQTLSATLEQGGIEVAIDDAEVVSEDEPESREETVIGLQREPVAKSGTDLFAEEEHGTFVLSSKEKPKQEKVLDKAGKAQERNELLFDLESLSQLPETTKADLIEWKNKNLQAIDDLGQPHTAEIWDKLTKLISEAGKKER